MTPSCAASLDREDLVDSFGRDFPAATEEQASCVVGRLLDRFPIEEIEQELASDPASTAFANTLVSAMAACGYDLSSFDRWTLAFVGELVELGYEPDVARCAAERLSADLTAEEVEALTAGELPAGFRQQLRDALDRCDGS